MCSICGCFTCSTWCPNADTEPTGYCEECGDELYDGKDLCEICETRKRLEEEEEECTYDD